MTRSLTAHGGSDIVNFAYTYDADSNIISQQFVHRSGTPYNTYTYDDLDRLTRSDYHDSRNEQFTLDDLGNRDSYVAVNGTTTTYTYDSNVANEYTQVVAGGVTHTPLYDDAGNITRDAQGYYHSYDYENRLVQVKDTNNTNTVAEYAYDALGRRIQSIDSDADVTKRYYYDGWRALSETDEDDVNQRDYVYGNYLDEVLVMADANDHYFAHDHLLSPVALIASNGTIDERYEYDAYGKCNIWDGTFANSRSVSSYGNTIGLTGQRFDRLDNNSLDLGNYKNRIYLVDLGRFAQRDPFGIRADLVSFLNDMPQVVCNNDWLSNKHIQVQKYPQVAPNLIMGLVRTHTINKLLLNKKTGYLPSGQTELITNTKFTSVEGKNYDPSIPTIKLITPSGIDSFQQYHDGMNLYQYCGSNILNSIDPFGFSGCPKNTCNRWGLTPKFIYAGGYGLAYVGLTTKLEADESCCMDVFSKEYFYNGIGLGVGINLSIGFGGTAKWFDTSCISWNDHLGSGRLTSGGVVLIAGGGAIIVETPQTYLEFVGSGWGVDASIATTLGMWEF